METQYLFTSSNNLKNENGKMIRRVERWIDSPELAKIVASFGGEMPKDLSVREKIAWLLTFSQCWDYRKNQNTLDSKTGENARWRVSSENITEEQKRAVEEGIFSLGLIGVHNPKCKFFDYILVLGGARFSCLYRSRYARELLKHGVNAREVVLLSGMRQIAESEREATDIYAPCAKTEYDLINAGGEEAFCLSKEFIEERYYNENPNLNWAIRTYLRAGEIPITSFSGPSLDPENRRANSSDTYKFFLEKKRVSSKSRLLLITSQIYVPYQQIEAVRILGIPHSLYIETVGFPTSWGQKLQGMRGTANYLQEIRSTIQAMARIMNII